MMESTTSAASGFVDLSDVGTAISEGFRTVSNFIMALVATPALLIFGGGAVEALLDDVDLKLDDYEFVNYTSGAGYRPAEEWVKRKDPCQKDGYNDPLHMIYQGKKDRAQPTPVAACAQTGQAANLKEEKQSFVYMDVGLWAGTKAAPRRDFGVVYGTTAALCAYVPKGAPEPTWKSQAEKGKISDSDAATSPEEVKQINRLLQELSKDGDLQDVYVRRCHTASATHRAPARRKIYVILGDMHLPVITEEEGRNPDSKGSTYIRGQTAAIGAAVGRRMGRYSFTASGEVMTDDAALVWLERYIQAEIFEGAGEDLARFATLLKKAATILPIHLVQVGDMFDLWLGFDRYFRQSPPSDKSKVDGSERIGQEGRVLLLDDRDQDEEKLDCHGHKVGDNFPLSMQEDTGPDKDGNPMLDKDGNLPVPCEPASDVEKNVKSALDALTERVTPTQFINFWIERTYYDTSQSKGVRAISECFDGLGSNGAAMTWLWGNHDNYLGRHHPGVLKERVPRVDDREERVYITHGHEWDDWNRDGAIAGQRNTQTALYANEQARAIDALVDGRKDRLKGVATLYKTKAKADDAFCVFVMGHTHEAILIEVEISDSPDSA